MKTRFLFPRQLFNNLDIIGLYWTLKTVLIGKHIAWMPQITFEVSKEILNSNKYKNAGHRLQLGNIIARKRSKRRCKCANDVVCK